MHQDATCMCGIVAFVVDGMEATAIKERMQDGLRYDVDGNSEEGVDNELCCYHLSIILATSTPLDSLRTGLGGQSLIRASVSYFNTKDEIDLFCQGFGSMILS